MLDVRAAFCAVACAFLFALCLCASPVISALGAADASDAASADAGAADADDPTGAADTAGTVGADDPAGAADTAGAALAADAAGAAGPATDTSTVRVAVSPLDGFFNIADDGTVSGYGVDLLGKVSQYTGITFTYVVTDSWEKTKGMLIDGEADLRMPASAPSAPSTTLSYGTSSIMDTYNVLACPASREDLYYQDYAVIDTLSIVVVDSFYTQNDVQEYLDSIGVPASHLVFTDDFNAARDLVDSGQADAFISNAADMTDDYKSLVRFGSDPTYFSMLLDNPVLATIDAAVAQIKVDEPLYLTNLALSWFPDRSQVPLTREESTYLRGIGSITFAFQPDEGYLSRYEDGSYYGIYVEYAKMICEKLGVDFKAISATNGSYPTPGADALAGFYYDLTYADEYGYALSVPIDDINYDIITQMGRSFDERTCTIAAISKFRYTKQYVEVYYPDATILYFDSYAECLDAVADGRADMTIINNYIAEYYLGMYRYADLVAHLSSEWSHLYCFAAMDGNDALARCISKALSMMTDDERNQCVLRAQDQRVSTNPLVAAIYQNPMGFALLAAGVMALLVAVVMLVGFSHRSKKRSRQLEVALSAKSDFMARMSHDMRTPLNAILGFTYLMADEDNVDAVKDYIPKLQESGGYLLQLISDVLDTSKAENGKLVLNPAPCDERVLFDSIVDMMGPLMEAKGIDFRFTTHGIEWQNLLIDAQRVKQVFMNLLSNALKYTPAGGRVEFEMELIARTPTSVRDRFVVRDTGVGMSADFLPHVFEAFSREGRSKDLASEGSGLGMSVVKQLVELMGGTIEIKSEVDRGTEVMVYLEFPLASGETAGASGQTCKRAAAAPDAGSIAGLRILMCEDNEVNATIARRLLERMGCTVDCAVNGREGVHAFEGAPLGGYDVVLMDLRMPEVGGLEAARAIRGLDRADAATVPIIALTANVLPADVDAAHAAGMNDLVAKPIDPAALRAAIMRHCVR